MKRKLRFLGTLGVVIAFLATVYLLGLHNGQKGQEFPNIGEAEAAGGKVKSRTSTAPDRYAYYPGTEELAADEMRVTACGTGLPAARHGQAATCWIVELGNGDKFFFDIGTGSMSNVAAYMIPYDYLDKVFISHLHT
ncbi:MAG: hypothetical protein ACR2PS_00860, partial [Pseudomonadales bacterium]